MVARGAHGKDATSACHVAEPRRRATPRCHKTVPGMGVHGSARCEESAGNGRTRCERHDACHARCQGAHARVRTPRMHALGEDGAMRARSMRGRTSAHAIWCMVSKMHGAHAWDASRALGCELKFSLRPVAPIGRNDASIPYGYHMATGRRPYGIEQ
jgi:hypothetical protein